MRVNLNIRSFKQVFAAFCALVLCGLGLAAGFALKNTPSIWGLPSMRELTDSIPGYYSFTVTALAVIGILLGTFVGPLLAQQVVNLGNAIEQMSTRDKVALTSGTFIGLVVSYPFFVPLSRIAAYIGMPIWVLIATASVYLGIRATWSMKDELWIFGANRQAPSDAAETPMEHCKILDTNVIIDGRIADICRSGFLEGPIYIPGFVLDELQHIADSSDSLKRARGRRGLDILNAMQKDFPLIVRSYDNKLGAGHAHDEVDTRLVTLARNLDGDIVTNDFNLNKVAALQGVTVLNVNELANALKPVVLPGEEMVVAIIREGKEPNQGVAYLDDGTMIVVEDGRRFIGETVDVAVTSVLQTVAGKMIFARMKDSNGDSEESHDRGSGRSSGGPRNKVR